MLSPAAPRLETRAERIAVLAALGQTAIAVATTFIAAAALRAVDALALTMLRLGLGAAVMLAWLWWRRAALAAVPRRDVLGMSALGVLGVTLNQGFFLRGLSESTPGRSSLLYALTPVFVFLIGRARGSERLVWRRIVGITLAFVGVALVLSERHGLASASLRGDLLIICGVVSWAAYTALGKPMLSTYDPMLVTAVGLVAGAAAFMPVGVPAVVGAPLAELPLWVWGAIVFMAVISSVGAYLLWYVAIKRMAASRVAVFMNLQPPLVVLVSWLLFDEPVTMSFLVGAVLVLVGVRQAAAAAR